MKTVPAVSLVPLLLCSLGATGCFSLQAVRPLSHFHVFSLASSDNPPNQFRASTLLTSTASDSAATTTSSASPPEKEKKNGLRNKLSTLLKNVKTAPFALSIVAFLVGYKLGGKAGAAASVASGTTTAAAVPTARAAARRYPIVATILLIVAIRDTWSLIPNWAKKNLPFIRRRTSSRALPGEEEDDPDDLTSFASLSLKLRTLYQRGKQKLASGDEIPNAGIVFLALLQITSQIKQQLAHGRDQLYEDSGTLVNNPKDVLEGMQDYFEYADWAYDELPEPETLQDNLKQHGYSLLRHEKTVLPGHVAHYVAVNTEKKEALIGIKGTSGLEDMITDCVGNAVQYQFEGDPFVDGARQQISCHEGILLSSKRLADDLLTFVQDVLLPSGYKITVTGHSLGAGVAVIFAMILRSRISQLRQPDKLRVLAFASPPILDYQASKNCESFVTTFVNNSDIIPRCSLSNLVVLLEFMKTVNRRLDQEGLKPKDMKSTAAFAKWMTQGKHGELILSPQQIQDNMDAALNQMDLQDPDHLYVAGKVVHMFDEWTKPNYGDKSDYEQEQDPSKVVPTAEKIYVAGGASKALRIIEMDDRMLTDHMSPGYRASIRSLLKLGPHWQPTTAATATTTGSSASES